jgi:lysophospholipase L1-like esterase
MKIRPSQRRPSLAFLGAVSLLLSFASCGGDDGPSGGAAGSGGTSGTGGLPGSGGSGSGGTSSAGGSSGAGGTTGAGGTPSSGGTSAGGARTGGSSGTGGSTSAGGARSGGSSGTGGTSSLGGSTGSGGLPGTGGSTGTADAGTSPDTASPADSLSDNGGSGEAAVRLQGRFDLTDATRPSFGWSGSAMVARFEGTGATLRIDGSPNQFAVVVDGKVSSQVLKVASGTTQYTLASGLAAGVHDVVVWKRTEGNQGDNRFLGVQVTGGQLQAPPGAPERRIEVYGDSITAGYGMDGSGPYCPWSVDTENHYLTYAAITARELDAELHAIAWSGIGMYRNYDVPGASSDAMPYVYARTLPTQSASKWDFSTWQPHVVVINLGTNDASTNGDPGTPYRNAYLEFVRTLRQKYPDTYFVLTIGPMLDGSNLTAIKGHIQAVIDTRSSEGDSRMSFLEFPVQSSADGYGCDWHPSAKTNAKMATLLTAELKARLGW